MWMSVSPAAGQVYATTFWQDLLDIVCLQSSMLHREVPDVLGENHMLGVFQ